MPLVLKILFTFFLSQSIIAQENFYDYVKPGKYQVGLTDTVIFDTQYNYEEFGYKGKKPYFIKIWHPIKKQPTQNYLKVEDLFVFKSNEALQSVQDSLESIYKNHFIRDYLTENLITGEEQNYGVFSYQDVLNLIGKIETRSIKYPLTDDNDFPVIVYYNGSQGHPFENYVMAEYFASRGFIFVAASFELQFENSPFGLLPYDRYITDEEEQSLKHVTDFAQTLSNSSFTFFIGHSFGAQMGLRTFGEDSTISGMISLETSIEFKTDYEVIKEMWPEVYQKVITEKTHYPFPILFCAATGESKPFNLMNEVSAKQTTYASTIEEFQHNAYLSFFFLRYFLDDQIEQLDKTVIKKSLPIYIKHLNFLHDFLNVIITKKNHEKKEISFIK